MFAKVFTQILDSSLAEDWQTRHVFEDMLKLCDSKGVLDTTQEALARRTNVPVEIVKAAIAKLELPDPSSRTPNHDGRRIMRMDAHRDWGWQIVNFVKYRESASKEMLRMTEAERKRAYRAKFHRAPSPEPSTPIKSKKERENSPASVRDVSGTVRDVSGTVRDSPPVFAPLPAGLFRRELQDMLTGAKSELKSIKANPANFISELSDKATELIMALQKEKQEGWQAKVAEINALPENQKARLKRSALAVMQAWKDRIKDIERAMHGIRTDK
jgi:hypothetical protein